MTVSTRKEAAKKLAAEYVKLRKEQADGKGRKRGRAVKAAESADPQTDSADLSAHGADMEACSELTPSKPVTVAEKTALQSLFSSPPQPADTDEV